MKKYVAYGIGAALVDTEIKVVDGELSQMNVEKGVMTLVDEQRRSELIDHLEGHLVKARVALAQGKKTHDKRDTEKDRDWNRQKQRVIRENVKQ